MGIVVNERRVFFLEVLGRRARTPKMLFRMDGEMP